MKVATFLILLGFAVAKSDVNVLNIDFKNDIVLNSKFLCFNNEIDGVSEKCGEKLNALCNNTSLLWTMLDASSKFPYTGLGYATRMDYGNFDQCTGVDQTFGGVRILGEHCTVGLVIPDPSNITDENLFFKLSVCRPEGCMASDFNSILSTKLNFTLPLFQDSFCQTKETGTKLTAADIVTIVLIVVIVLLMIISTTYDFYLHRKQIKPHNPLFLSFSILSNGRKLLHISKNSKEQFHTFHGLKVISMMWIVAGHGMVGWLSISVTNQEDRDTFVDKRYAGYITTSQLSVDTFFFISGFLLAFQYLKQKQKPLMAHVATIPHMYLHRYLRLTPALFVIYMVNISLFRHLGSGPVYHPLSEVLVETCRKQWWSFFLYIQNYHNWDDLCMTQTWYLSADMQMFLLAPLVLIPIALQLKSKSGFWRVMVELLILNIICTIFPMVIKLMYQDYKNTYDTHSRLIDYYIGVMLAVFMRVKQDKPFLYIVKRNQVSLTNLIIWIVILLGMLTTVVCYQEMEMNHGYEAKSVFYSLMRPAWCIGLSWIVYSCYHDHGGIVNWILCRPIFQIWGRLTYCMYLVHGAVIACYIINIRTSWYFSDYNGFYAFCGHYIVSLIVSTFWTLAFESPLIVIEKFIFGKANRKKEQAKPAKNGNVEDGAKVEWKTRETD